MQAIRTALTLQKLELSRQLALNVLRRCGAAPRRCPCLCFRRRCLLALLSGSQGSGSDVVNTRQVNDVTPQAVCTMVALG